MLGILDRIDQREGGEWQERITYEFSQLLIREKAAGSDIHKFYEIWNAARNGNAIPNESDFKLDELVPIDLTARLGLADVSHDDPAKFRMLIHGGRTFSGFQGQTLDQFPSRLNVELVAAEYWRCKFSAAPFYSEIDQQLNCSTRHYFRGLFPVGEDSRVTKVYLAYRPISMNQQVIDT